MAATRIGGTACHDTRAFHDAGSKITNDADVCAHFVEYGRRLEKLIAEVKAK